MPSHRLSMLPWAALAATLVLGGCASTPPTASTASPLELHIAHINDHHSHLAPQPQAELLLDGVPTRVSMGGFARVTQAMQELQASHPHLLKLHAGDALSGTLYHTLFKGAADARLMNTVCFDAFVLGNHEFNDGDAGLQGFLNELAQGPCNTPVLAANVRPSRGTPLLPQTGNAYLQPYTIKTVQGHPVGIVGITVADKTVNASRPLPSTSFLDEVRTAQRQIDRLQRQGVRHIVLLTHQGYERDLAMAQQLSGVDVIIGGDSHSLLGDFAAVGMRSSAGPYPTQARNRDGETVCIGQAWEHTKALGLMQVRFDVQGRVERCAGQASLLIGPPFARQSTPGQWTALPAAEEAALTRSLQTQPAVRVVTPHPQASEILATYTAQIQTQMAQRIGQANQALCLVRVPGEATNRSASVPGCETANTLARGSDVAQAVAQGFLHASQRAHLALQNAGGVRVPIAAGPITMNTAFSVLPFSNVLVEMDLSGAEIRAALEDAVSNHLDQRGSDGSHPYAAGLRWELDMSQPRGQRFSNLQVRDRLSGQYSALDPARRYIVVTNDFIASGRDGYATLGAAFREGRFVNTQRLYTQSFVDFIGTQSALSRTTPADASHQRVTTANGRVLP